MTRLFFSILASETNTQEARMLIVTITEKGKPSTCMTLPKKEITVGRLQGNDVVLPKGNISKRHFRCEWRPSGVWVVDLKASSGTYVHNHRINGPKQITNEDRVYIGDFALQFEGIFEEPADDTPPEELQIVCDPQTTTAQLESMAPRSLAARRVLASRADAQTSLLLRFSEGYDLKTLRALAQNPGAPPSALFSVGAHFPEELWGNPALPLLLLESEVLSSLSKSPALHALCALPCISEQFLRMWLEAPEEVVFVVLCSPGVTSELLSDLYARGATSDSVVGSILASPKATTELVREIYEQRASASERVLCAVICSPNVPREIVQELCARSDNSPTVTWALERQPEYKKPNPSVAVSATPSLVIPLKPGEVFITIKERGVLLSSVALKKTETMIGRVLGNDVVLARNNISKQHCKLLLQEGGLSHLA